MIIAYTMMKLTSAKAIDFRGEPKRAIIAVLTLKLILKFISNSRSSADSVFSWPVFYFFCSISVEMNLIANNFIILN